MFGIIRAKSLEEILRTGIELSNKKTRYITAQRALSQDFLLFCENMAVWLNKLNNAFVAARQDTSLVFALFEQVMEIDAVSNVQCVSVMQKVDELKALLSDQALCAVVAVYHGKETEELDRERERMVEMMQQIMALRGEAFDFIQENCQLYPLESEEFIEKHFNAKSSNIIM